MHPYPTPQLNYAIRVPIVRIRMLLRHGKTMAETLMRALGVITNHHLVQRINEWDKALYAKWAPKLDEALPTPKWDLSFLQRMRALLPAAILRPSLWRTIYLVLICLSLLTVLNILGKPEILLASNVIPSP